MAEGRSDISFESGPCVLSHHKRELTAASCNRLDGNRCKVYIQYVFHKKVETPPISKGANLKVQREVKHQEHDHVCLREEHLN